MMRVFDGNVNSKKKPFGKDKCLKGILRRNIELFLKKPIEEKLGISQIKQVKFFFFSISNRLYFLFLLKYEPPSLHFIFD